ncbi:hypothetical protein F5Y14DRAFT_466248 [Nemania sp. NC0429]|nr:hypothetical protein F5Y14DRAFT_466248 [Nemania sp. NC0429]
MEYIDPQLLSDEWTGRSTADKGTQTEPEFYPGYPPLLYNYYPPLPGWYPTPQMADYYPRPDFAYPYHERPAMFVDPQAQYGCFPGPDVGYEPQTLVADPQPQYGGFPEPGVMYEPPTTFLDPQLQYGCVPEPDVGFMAAEPINVPRFSPESPLQDSIVVKPEEQGTELLAKISKPDPPRRSARLRKKRSSASPEGSASRKPRSSNPKATALQPGENLDKPLSKLALEMPHIPKFDMDAFVRRSAKRRVHYEGDGGKVKINRPANPFILYRTAYLHYAKALSKLSCTQSISRMIGASYRSEGQEVKDQFARYAAIEKEQHSLHFPNYKFVPRRFKEEI